jgi:CheY-like chemotaxis protein
VGGGGRITPGTLCPDCTGTAQHVDPDEKSHSREVAGSTPSGKVPRMHTPGGTVDVLLVEDDELILETLGDALNLAGLDTVRSSNAEAALALLREDKPRVVVTDINLGSGMDGLALGRAAHASFPELPIVYISGRYGEVRGLKPHERFLTKPFTASVLLGAIAEVRAPGKPAV